MSVDERIQLIKLAQKLTEHKEYAEYIGVKVVTVAIEKKEIKDNNY